MARQTIEDAERGEGNGRLSRLSLFGRFLLALLAVLVPSLCGLAYFGNAVTPGSLTVMGVAAVTAGLLSLLLAMLLTRQVRGSLAMIAREARGTAEDVELGRPLELPDLDAAVESLPEVDDLRRSIAVMRKALAVRDEREALLVRDLNHRIKNVLGLVRTVLGLSARNAQSIPDFVTVTEGRIRALTVAHDLLLRERLKGVSLGRLVEAQLAPYAERVVLDGFEGRGDVLLTASAAQNLAFVLHELATNAAKYGALSGERGQVTVRRHLLEEESEPFVRLEWRESGGPRVVEPQETGVGLEIINSVLSSGRAPQMRFSPAGLECDIDLPARMVADALSAR